MNGISFFRNIIVSSILFVPPCSYATSTIDYIKLGSFVVIVGGVGYGIHTLQNKHLPKLLNIQNARITIVEIENQSESAVRIISPTLFNALISKITGLQKLYHSFVIPAQKSLKVKGNSGENQLNTHSAYERNAIYHSLALHNHTAHSDASIILQTQEGWFNLYADYEQGDIFAYSSHSHNRLSLWSDLDCSYYHHIKIIITPSGTLAITLK